MKTLAKVFIIIGMICQCFLIFPLILGIIALKKLNAAKKKEDFSIGWAIVVLLVNLIAGIVLLVMKDEDFAK
jgi:hypothetical protein